MRRRRFSVAELAIIIALAVISLTIVLPLAYMVLTSFKTIYEYVRDPLGLPERFNLANYVAMYTGYNLVAYFRNSFIVSVVPIGVSLLVTVPAAYAIAKLRTRWGRPLHLAVLSLMMVPAMVTLIPRYVMYSRLHLVDNLLSLILSYSAGSVPFTLYLLVANFRSIPDEMIEAVKMDGATYPRVLRSVVVPMGKPALITASIVLFVNCWNELVQAMLYINRDELRTLTAVVANMGGRYISNMPLMMAGLTLASIPTIAVYVFFERYLEAGITAGSFR